MHLPNVHTSADSERRAAIGTVVLGFATDPVMRWLWPQPEHYLAAMPRFIEAFSGRAFDHGSAFVTDYCRGAALWLPPGVTPDSEAMAALMAEMAPEALLEDLGILMAQMATYHPEEPHWYLPQIAVDPACQGQGLGAALMKHALARCDADGVIAYLESSNPRNVSLYERHGFEVMGTIEAGRCPPMQPMIRRPGG
ncbi:MAG: GNAT family N-acetyltransferase [Pseudomonadota bacterium]